MAIRHVPIRTCIATGEKRPKNEMIRLVRIDSGEVVIDLKGKEKGRGANLTQTLEAFDLAVKKKIITKALKLEKPKDSWGFFQEDYWGFIPNIECAVCYDKLGDYEKAEKYNDVAEGYKPDSPAVLYNKEYFKSRKETSVN